jgi:hypothetical protein
MWLQGPRRDPITLVSSPESSGWRRTSAISRPCIAPTGYEARWHSEYKKVFFTPVDTSFIPIAINIFHINRGSPQFGSRTISIVWKIRDWGTYFMYNWSGDKECRLLWCYAVWLLKEATFRRKITPPSSRWICTSSQRASVASYSWIS